MDDDARDSRGSHAAFGFCHSPPPPPPCALSMSINSAEIYETKKAMEVKPHTPMPNHFLNLHL